MADISKCKGENCKLKLECYRFLAPSGYWQTYADFDVEFAEALEKNPDTKCEWFWKR